MSSAEAILLAGGLVLLVACAVTALIRSGETNWYFCPACRRFRNELGNECTRLPDDGHFCGESTCGRH